MGAGIDQVCSRAVVRGLADPGSLARGAVYASQGRVERLAGSTERVTATVRGSMPYAVELRADGDALAWSCSCPIGEDGGFCKHCVAVALTLDPEGPDALFDPDEGEDDVGGADPDGDRLTEYVERLDHERLVALVVEQAGGDRRLRERLLAEAAAESGEGVDLASWGRGLATAFDPGGFVAYAEAASWAQDVAEALDGLEELLDAGQPAAVVELAEQAHRLAEDSLGSVDDSDGWLRDIAGRIGELHLRACEAANPDPVALAGRLVALELGGELEAFHRAAARYAPVLGAAGLAEYRRLLAPRFDALPTGRGPLDGGFTERFRVKEAMVGVALGAGDVDELVAVKARDLATPDDYREVASALADAGRTPEAIEWAEDGLASFADRPWQTPPLRELLAGLHRDVGDVDAAVEVFRVGFEASPSLACYQRLLAEAEAAGDLAGTRERALDCLRARLGGRAVAADEPGRRRGGDADGHVAAEILLYEGEVDEAWRVARTHGCQPRLWLAMAHARERTHPADAIAVYEREVADRIAAKDNRGYRAAVDLLERMRRCYAALGRDDDFAAHLAGIRAEHGRKRNLMKLFAERGW